jgi:hypothetical protein
MGLFGGRNRDPFSGGPAKARMAGVYDPSANYGGTDLTGQPVEGLNLAPQPMPQQAHPSAFGRGGMGWNIIGAIGDSLAEMGGYQGAFGQAQREHRQQQDAETIWTRRQQSQLAQQKELYDYEQQHHQPAPNDTERDYAMLERLYGPDEAKRMYRDHYSMRWVQDAMGQWRQVGPTAPTPAPAGVTFTPLDDGGPGPQAPGGFPRR